MFFVWVDEATASAMTMLVSFLLLLGTALVAAGVLRVADKQADDVEWEQLATRQPADPLRFSTQMVADLPEPARRYFAFTIAPGTPLWPVAEVEMRGQFSLGNKDDPRYQPMQARQILAAPEGFVWTMRTCAGLPISGSDSGRWTRFRVLGLIPVARLGGNRDHARSAYGRCVAEAAFWSPAALLPGREVVWTEVDENTARFTVSHGEESQDVDITVDGEGRPLQVAFLRWSDANPEKVYRLQPFGGYLSEFREMDGYRLPFRVEAGNQFGTPDYFPFFIAEVTAIRFPRA